MKALDCICQSASRTVSDLKFSLVLCPDPFYLADADAGQPCSLRNATPAAFKGNDLFMHFSIRLTSSI
ncbi:hypothetical protein ALP42_200001 [Pseudomonas savastanoi pv. nerii]|uniref:Uncharacterized protein n=1 Tax=Pseudomonas savastanoi pv. nerii TaxID=360921 RepID=A0AB74BDN7_PSESS|nr:hypothetical protein ALP42_200001 [Pseudomonas savastanoi pv. nerii]